MVKSRFLFPTLFALFLLTSADAIAQQQPILPNLGLGTDDGPNPQDVSTTLQLLILFTILSLLPSIAVMTTAFIRISIVLGFVRRAIGTQQTPANEIIIGLSLFLTFYVMSPVFNQMYSDAVQPYLNGEILALEPGDNDAYGLIVTQRMPPFYVMLQRALIPLRNFMFGQIGESGAKDIGTFMVMAQLDKPNDFNDVPTHILIPAFMTSELKKAFMMGFMIFIPFLILDLVTSSILISMGMFQLPPAFISLPFKILLFVLVDGWNVLVRALGVSFFQNMNL